MDIAILKNVVVEIPLLHLAVFAALCTLAALTGRFKLLILFIYAALLYWVFLLNESQFGASESASLLHTGLFILTGAIFATCAIWVMITDR